MSRRAIGAAFLLVAAAACGGPLPELSTGAASTRPAGPGTASALSTGQSTVSTPLTQASSPTTCPTGIHADQPALAPPAELSGPLATKLTELTKSPVNQFSISIWVEGYGEVVSRQPDQLLMPASNQKLWVAAAVHLLLPPDFTFRTRVLTTGTVHDGVLDGDLIAVGGGDPTLTTTGPHSLDSIAADIRSRGITTITGRVVIDESHYDTTRVPAGWEPSQMQYVGPISAFMVDWNNTRKQADFMNDPTRANASLFVDRLAKAGVTVKAGVAVERAPSNATPLLTVDSANRHGLLAFMLSESDNMMAESFVREIGVRVAGTGSTPAGLQAIDDTITRGLCLPAEGINGDGSGISHVSRHSAHYFRHLLEAMRAQPWGSEFVSELGVSGTSGTMKARLTDFAGQVEAKTGTVNGGRALSGFATTAAGRAVVFSVLGNGEDALLSTRAIDDLVGTVVGFAG